MLSDILKMCSERKSCIPETRATVGNPCLFDLPSLLLIITPSAHPAAEQVLWRSPHPHR